jgi:hypothetical protein
MAKRRWNDADLVSAVASNTTMSGVLRAMGLLVAGGSFRIVWAHIRRLGLDTSHWTGRANNVEGLLRVNKPKPLSEVLRVDNLTNSASLKRRLLRDGLLKNECSECRNGSLWNGRELVLELDHVNGDHADNRLENLRILCPNCHSQTPTAGSKNRRGRWVLHKCCECGKPLKRKMVSGMCRDCFLQARREGRWVRSAERAPSGKQRRFDSFLPSPLKRIT